MCNDDLISVIVPIYKVEKYLKKCINSLCKQTYRNLEIILVDDGSPDNCGKICDEFALKEPRIVVIHKKNGGLSSARNAGIEIAKGKYIGFVDSDDWIEETMYEKMITFLQSNNCDLVECAVNFVSNNKRSIYKQSVNEILDGKSALERQFKAQGNNYMPRIAVWTKLFKKDFWINRRFPVGKIHEDYMLTCEALYYSKKIGLIKEGLYNHLLTNSNSIMNSKFSQKDLYLEFQYSERTSFLEKNGETKLAKLAKESYYLLLLTLYWRCNINNMEEKDYYLNLLRKHKKKILSSEIKEKRMMEFKCFYFSPKLYMIMRKIIMRLRMEII